MPRLRKRVEIYYVNSIDMKGIINSDQNALSAEEFLEKEGVYAYVDYGDVNVYFNYHVEENMIAFARYHVERALGAVDEYDIIRCDKYGDYFCDKQAIIDSYPLDQIK